MKYVVKAYDSRNGYAGDIELSRMEYSSKGGSVSRSRMCIASARVRPRPRGETKGI